MNVPGNPWAILTGAFTLAVAGQWARDGKAPDGIAKSAVAFIGLGIIFGLVAQTRAKPLAASICWLILMGAAWGAVPALSDVTSKSASKPKKPTTTTKKEGTK